MAHNSIQTKDEKDTHQRILDAAVGVFAEKGYHAAKVDDIVEASDSSKGSVYFHFSSKQEIFLAIIDQFAIELATRLAEAMATEPDGMSRVSAALRICLETFGEYHDLAKIFLVQAAGVGEAFEEKRMEIHDRFVSVIQAYLDQAVAEGDIIAEDTHITALAWMGALNEVVIRWVLTGQPDPTRSFPALRATLLRSIGVAEDRIRAQEEA